MRRKLEELDLATLKSLIGDWLESPEAANAPLGLEVDEAFRRAEQLKPLIVAGVISPEEVELDEDLKEVLYALDSLVADRRRGAACPQEARAVYRFLRGLSWPDDDLGEKDDLMDRCALAARDSAPVGANAAAEPVEAAPSNEQIRKVFEESAPLIRAILVKYHDLTEPEAVEFEKDLLTWFTRFCQRPNATASRMRTLLLAQCSRLAREYQRFRATPAAQTAEGRLASLFGWTPSDATGWNRGPRKEKDSEPLENYRSSRK